MTFWYALLEYFYKTAISILSALCVEYQNKFFKCYAGIIIDNSHPLLSMLLYSLMPEYLMQTYLELFTTDYSVSVATLPVCYILIYKLAMAV